MDVLEHLAGTRGEIARRRRHARHPTRATELLETDPSIRRGAPRRERRRSGGARRARSVLCRVHRGGCRRLGSADEPELATARHGRVGNIRAALTWAIETKRADTVVQFFAPRPFGVSELGRTARCMTLHPPPSTVPGGHDRTEAAERPSPSLPCRPRPQADAEAMRVTSRKRSPRRQRLH
jgi:hypothetical protein